MAKGRRRKPEGRPKGRPSAGRVARTAPGHRVSASRARRPQGAPRDAKGRFVARAVASEAKPKTGRPSPTTTTAKGKGRKSAASSSTGKASGVRKIATIYRQSVAIAGSPRDVLRDPHTGRFTKAAKGAEVVRAVKGKGGKLVPLTRTSRTKARRVGRNAVGDAFTDQARPGDALDMLASAAKDRRGVFVQFGGRVFKVPASKQADLRAFVTDLKSKFFQAARRTKVGSPDLWFGVAIGDNGVMLNLDSIEMMDPELAEEFAANREFIEATRDLAAYTADRFGYYLGADVNAAAIAKGWQDELNEQADSAYDEDEDEGQ